MLANAVRGEIEFSAYLKTDGVMKFALGDPAARKKPDWFALGGIFDGYTVIGFDAKKETLAVEKAGMTTYLPLKPGALPQVAQTDEAQRNSPYAVAPQLDERRRMEQVLEGERRPASRRKSELDNLIDGVGNSAGRAGEALSVARPVRIGGPGDLGGGMPSAPVALTPFTFQRDSAGTQPAGVSVTPDSGKITIAPVSLTPQPAAPRNLAVELQPTPQAQRPIVTRLDIPDWERPDYVLRSYRERLQDLRTRYPEEHEWVQSYKARIEDMEREHRRPPSEEVLQSHRKRLEGLRTRYSEDHWQVQSAKEMVEWLEQRKRNAVPQETPPSTRKQP
jgi:hypothetical protein